MKKADERQLLSDEASPEGLCHVVGIGASAGGLESLQQLFGHIAPGGLLSFVVIQHLSPSHRSMMADILSHHTKLRVTQAGDGMTIEPDTVYLIPPGRNLTIAARTLQLTDQPPGLNMPIDIFLSSLAADVREKAIGIILSGTGSDGSKGIVDIKRYGGKVIVQDGRSAKFDGMPMQAQQTGKVDYTLPPERMGKLLDRLALGEDVGEVEAAFSPDMQDPDEGEGELEELVRLMQRETSVDFSFYKTASLMRRVERRMGLVGVGTLGEYIEHVRKQPGELKQLKRDLLIHVTNFFRDPDAFARLEELVLPELISTDRSGEVRVWVPGCATGEEAYSIAILIVEYMQRNELQMKFRLRIFATDIDKESVEYAVQGLYPESIAGSVSEDRLRRFFVRSGDAYRVSDTIRRMVVFLPHNVTKDAPFHHIDLVSCRNTLIYLQPDMQQKVLKQFQFALNPRGFLFLGPSETLGKLAPQFHVLDQRWNMFRLREADAAVTPTPFWNGERGVPQLTRLGKERGLTSGLTPEGGFRPDGLQAVLLDEHMTPSLVVDENLEIVHMSGGMGRFMRWSSGRPTWNLRKLFDPKLAVALSTAAQKVRRDQKPASFIGFETDQGVPFELTVKPFSTKHPQYAGLILLSFLEAQQRPPFEEPASMDPALRQRISLLEQQLQHAEDALRATIEELETSNEELQATNEELIASNEELQSTNEELQTVNEELVTVNSEYQYKIEELTELNNDMENFLASTKIGTIFLDTDMCVRRFTPAVMKEINLLEVDFGRPIAHISHSFKYEALVRDASRVLQTMEPLEREIQSRGGCWYSIRLLPYRTLEDEVRGIVITFVDITELKNMNEELVKLSYAVDQSPARVVMCNMDGKISYVNRKFSQKTGRRPEDVIGRNLREIGKWKPNKFKSMVAAIKEGRSWEGELQSLDAAGKPFREWVRLLPMTNPKGQIVHILWQAEDFPECEAN